MNIFDPLISGSLSVSGSGEISGDLTVLGTITATISGTSSNAISASHAEMYLLTSSFETFIDSNFNSYTSSTDDRIDGLETESGSIRSDFNNYTSSTDDRLDSLETKSGSLENRVGSLETETGSIRGDFNSYTSSNNDRVNDLETESGSIRTDFNSYTSSNNDRVGSLETESGSIRVDFNSYTSSTDDRIDSIETESGSIRSEFNSYTSSTDDRVDSLETESGSVRTDLNTYTSSTDLRLVSIETNSGSNNDRLDAIELTTGSLNQFTSSINTTIKNRLSAEDVITGSIQVDITGTSGFTSFSSSINNSINNTSSSLSSSIAGYNLTQDERLDSIETESGSIRTDFNSYTSSNDSTNTTQNSRLTSLENATSSLSGDVTTIDGRVDSLETESGSIRTDFNSYTSSNNTTNTSQNNRLSALETESGSIRDDFNIITSSFDDRLYSLETTSGSHNTRIGDLESFETTVNDGLEFTGSNVTVKGNLLVKGTETIVNSTTVDIGDNIISLNGSGAANAGIEVRDATSPSTSSGSLLWDTTNNYWMGGIKGSEQRILTTSDAGSTVQAYDSTLAAVAGGTYTGDDSIITVGTIETGSWQGSVIASAYLDADTAHLSGTQTFTGAKTFNNGVTANTLRLTSTTDATVSSTGHAFQIGGDASTNIIIDNNEIMARNNGAVSSLNLNPDGGDITIHNNTTAGTFTIGGNTVWHSGNDDVILRNRGTLSSGQDLDTYRSTGIWSQESNAQAAAGSNYPVDFAGQLIVIDQDYGNGLQTKQEYLRYNTNDEWYRSYYNGTWQSWVRRLNTSDVGSNVQAYDADLTTLGGLAKTDGNFIVGNGTTWVVESGATARTSLGLGSAATSAATDFVAVAGDTMSGTLTASGGINGLTLANGISGTNFNITGVNQLEIADPGEGIVWKSGTSGDISLYTVDDSNDNILYLAGTGASMQINGNRVLTTADEGSGNGLDADTLDGQHASAFLTSYTETDTLATVTGRGASTTTGIQLNSGATIDFNKTNATSGGDTNFLTIGYNGSWSSNANGMAAIEVNDGSGTVGKFGISYNATDEGYFAVKNLYNGGSYGASGTVFKVDSDGDGYFSRNLVIAGDLSGVTDLYVADQIIHTGDTDTYTQFHAADQWRVVTGGIERLEVNNSAVTTSGRLNVGEHLIATSNVYAGGNEGFVFGNTTADGEYIKRNGDNIEIFAGGSNRLTVNGSTGALSGNGSGLTSLNASNISSGTFPDLFDAATRYNIGLIDGNSSLTRDKIRVWTGGQYTIGMKNGYDYGHLGDITGNEYAMSFQMNDDADRGFWWGHENHTDDQGAMSLTTDGELVVAKSISVGEGESVTNPSSTPLYVYGSGSTVFQVEGSVGQLFSIDDDLTGEIFAVSDISGIPILSVDSSGVVTIDDTLYVTGDITAYYSSDERLKKNIKPIEEPLEKLKQISGNTFEWDEENPVHRNTGKDVGVIAQEIEKVLPELVTERKGGYKAVQYEKIVALLIESNKALLERVEELEKKLK